MVDDPLFELRALALAGDDASLRVLNDAVMASGPLAEAYLLGRHEEVWEALRALGPELRAPGVWQQAWSIGWETMRRVRVNLNELKRRLLARGYRFLFPEEAVGTPASVSSLNALEAIANGPLPLSLHAFWAVVGSVDFRQHPSQTVHDWLEEAPSALAQLGDDDPLVIHGVSRILDAGFASPRDGRLFVYLSPDAFHKAGVSGCENYHVWLPEFCADVRVAGDVSPNLIEAEPVPLGQYVVDAIRRSIQGGGFRGRLSPSMDAWQPARPLQEELARGLLAL